MRDGGCRRRASAQTRRRSRPLGRRGTLQSQLGLKLEPKKGDVDMIVIDKIEKTPVEN
jgi:uncharacterized protein (TIGR03435 family)